MVRYLITNGADIKDALKQCIELGHPEITELVLQGANNPICPMIRDLPMINIHFMYTIIGYKNVSLFEKYYPMYLERHDPEPLLTTLISKLSKEKTEASYVKMFSRVIIDSNPNCIREKTAFTFNTSSIQMTILMQASLYALESIVKILLEQKDIQVNLRLQTESGKKHEFEGSTALHIACRKGLTNCVKMLLDANADLDIKDYKGRTPHHIATRVLAGEDSIFTEDEKQSHGSSNSRLQLFFGSEGIIKHSITDEQKTNLCEICVLLKERGACTEHEALLDTPDGRDFAVAGLVSAIHQGCKFNNIPLRADNTALLQRVFEHRELDLDIIKTTLLPSRFLPNMTDALLALATSDAEDEYARIENLIHCGIVDVNHLTIEHTPLLIVACLAKNEKLILWLATLGANVNKSVMTRTMQYITPLHTLIAKGNYDVAKKLIDTYCADVDMFEQSSSALHISLSVPNPNSDFFDFLLNHLEEPSAEMIGSCILTALVNDQFDFAIRLLSQFSINLKRTYTARAMLGHSQYYPLAVACQKANPDMVKYLLENGASPLVKISSDTEDVIHLTKRLLKGARTDP